MTKFLFLIKGELLRLKKYNVITVNLLVTLMWFLLLFFIDDHGLFNQLLPMVLMFDVTMMSIIFVGASLFFEKSEQSNVTLLVTPVSNHLHILSKSVVNAIHMTLSSLLLALIFFFVRQVEINFFYLTLALMISSFLHSLIGFVFSYMSKDFTSMLMLVMAYSVIFLVPTILHQSAIFFLHDGWQYFLLISPSQTSINLLEFGVHTQVNLLSLLSLLMMLAQGFALYFLIVYPKYTQSVIKQSGI